MIGVVKQRSSLLWLLLIGLAAFLRFNHLAFQSYWHDELYSIAGTHCVLSIDRVVKLAFEDVHPPLYNIILWSWHKLFGCNEFISRSLSAVAGIFSIPAIYFLGKELFGKRVGLYAATIAAFNYYLIYYSQEARSYALLVLLVILSFIFLIRLLREQNRNNLIGYIVSVVAAIYTHYYGLLVFASQAAFMLVFLSRGGIPSRLLKYGLIAIASIITMLLPLLPHIIKTRDSERLHWIIQPEPWYFIQYLQGYFLSESLTFILGLFLILGIINIWSRRKDGAGYIGFSILGLWLVLIYIVPYLKGLVSTPMLYPRYTIVALPAILIVIAVGISAIKYRQARYMILVLINAMALYSLFGTDYYTKVTKEQYRELTAEIIRADVDIPVYALKWSAMMFNVYFKQMESDIRCRNAVVLEALLAEGKSAKCFWLVDGHDKLFETDIIDKYNLHTIGKIEEYGAAALLLSTGNPEQNFCPAIDGIGYKSTNASSGSDLATD